MNAPLAHAFAHRDDEHDRPLFDALELGVRHVELDVWYLAGRLLVAHDPQDLRPGRTLDRLYLTPLVQAYRDARLAADDPTWIYVDVKTRAAPAHRAVERLAARHAAWVARPGDDARPLHLILTGRRPPYGTLHGSGGVCRYDGRLADLEAPRSVATMPTVWADWTRFTTWRGDGPMPSEDLARLRAAVRAARDEGQRLRFWATPDRPGPARDAVWRTLLDEGVDLLNSDDLEGLARFLRDRQAPTSSRSSA